VDALVMAGGRGTRLQPLTFSLPKPLLPVGGQPILEILLRQLRRQGFRRVFVSVGHKGHLVRSFLNELALDGVAVACVSEDEPLGTAGALRLLPPDVDELFVINGDILTESDHGQVLEGHRRNDAALTLVVHHHSVPLPYGVVDLEGDSVTGVREKPVLQLPVATGMYAMTLSRVLPLLPAGRSDMPDLINALAAQGRVRAHVTSSFWTDVADLADYERIELDSQRWAEP
jgi:NDP-sugar pyrophosphorylase family protein